MDQIIRDASEVCLAKFLFLNIATVEQIIDPLSWDIQNNSRIIKQVATKYILKHHVNHHRFYYCETFIPVKNNFLLFCL